MESFLMRILVADDNPVFQNVLKTMLNSWGYEVLVAADGDQAWHILQSEDGPRMAILDWMMPGMEGIEVCRRVRGGSGMNRAYILILTAKAQSEDLRAAIDAGADDYVTKPFKSQELRARLRAGSRIVELEQELRILREMSAGSGRARAVEMAVTAS
jgi:DNA-binding response OmpR family regulator